MTRSSTIRRVFSLSPYNTIEFTDTISDIPEEIYLNPDKMRSLTYVQLSQIQLSYYRYLDLLKKLEDTSDEFKFIKELGQKSLVEIKELLTNNIIKVEGE